MNPQIIEQFRQNFQSLMEERHNLENEIKKESSKEITDLIAVDKFDASKEAVESLKLLMNEIHSEFNFQDISENILNHVRKMEQLKGDFPIQTQETKDITNSSAFSQAVFSNTSVSEEVNQKEETVTATNSESGNFTDFIREQFTKHQFEVVGIEGENIELVKKRKKYWLTITNPNLTEKDYIDILDEKAEKKNIGFLCENEEEISTVRAITEQWGQQNTGNKTKFLHVNFTSKQRLEQAHQENGELFQIKSF